MSELKADKTFVFGEECEAYKKSEADKVIAEKDAEITKLKALAKEPFLSNRVCRKCGKEGTLMYMPAVEDNHTFWDLYNNRGIDYVFGIQCAHCGETAFVTKQTHEYDLHHQKHKRCLAMAKLCQWKMGVFIYKKEKNEFYYRWYNRWLAIAEKFKEAK